MHLSSHSSLTHLLDADRNAHTARGPTGETITEPQPISMNQCGG